MELPVRIFFIANSYTNQRKFNHCPKYKTINNKQGFDGVEIHLISAAGGTLNPCSIV